jgi:hypothetical protein
MDCSLVGGCGVMSGWMDLNRVKVVSWLVIFSRRCPLAMVAAAVQVVVNKDGLNGRSNMFFRLINIWE